ncbi:MAG: YhcH/YjgK/YiaL family protein [Patescibacteria group bacterium]|nr:YhcH/YjgK/YiaL family protein [Patescibacteria group bacterium]
MFKKEIIIKRELIDKIAASLTSADIFGEEILANDKRSVIVSKNVTGKKIAAKAEIHDNYADIFLVKDGQEKIFIGGEISDKRKIAPGEWRGEILKNAKTYNIKAGDIIIIPKGIAHRHGEGLVKMIVIKIGK